MAELSPVYLVSGDDDAKIDSWRTRLRRRAEAEGGAGSLEALDARSADAAEIGAALSALTFSTGTRYVLVEGVESWKAGDVEPVEQAVAQLAPDTVVLLAARGKVPASLAKAVKKAGGQAHECPAPKPWEMPKWVVQHAQELGLHLDPEAAKALVAIVGAGQQRLAREIEKLAVAAHPRTQLSAEDVVALAAGETAPQVYDLADALVAGDARQALALAEELRARDERPGRLVFPIVRRLREVHRAAELLDAGVPEQKVAAEAKMAPWAAKRTVARARKADREALERALCGFADLEVEMRGGGELDEDTAFSLALARAAA